MKLVGCVVGMSIALGSVSVFAENVKVIDRRGDKMEEGGYAMFCHHVAEYTQSVVALCKGDSPERMQVETAFGLSVQDSESVASGVSADAIARLRGIAGDNETQTLIVRIDSSQYAAALEAIKEWTESEGFIDPPETINLNMASKIVRTIGLKSPYRSRRTVLVEFFDDLWKLNR